MDGVVNTVHNKRVRRGERPARVSLSRWLCLYFVQLRAHRSATIGYIVRFSHLYDKRSIDRWPKKQRRQSFLASERVMPSDERKQKGFLIVAGVYIYIRRRPNTLSSPPGNRICVTRCVFFESDISDFWARSYHHRDTKTFQRSTFLLEHPSIF